MTKINYLLYSWRNCAEYPVDNGEGQEGNDKSDNRVKDGVLCSSHAVAVTSRHGVANTTDDKHDHADCTNDEEEHVHDDREDRSVTKELCWRSFTLCTVHAVSQ